MICIMGIVFSGLKVDGGLMFVIEVIWMGGMEIVVMFKVLCGKYGKGFMIYWNF